MVLLNIEHGESRGPNMIVLTEDLDASYCSLGNVRENSSNSFDEHVENVPPLPLISLEEGTHHESDTADDDIAIDVAVDENAPTLAPAESPTKSRALSSNNSQESPSSKESMPSLPNNLQLGTSLWLDLVCLMLPACCCFASPSQV